MMRLWRRRRAPDPSLSELSGHLEGLTEVSKEIRDGLVTDRGRSHRLSVVSVVIGGLTLVATLLGIAVALQVRTGVEELSDLSAQEAVDLLRIGMSQDELARIMGAPPVVDQVLREQSEVAGGTVRRVVYSPADKDIAVTAFVDAFNAAQFIAVTSLANGQHLTYPPGNSGTYALIDFHGDADDRFRTGKTTLEELATQCLDGYSGFGGGASWGYLAIGCNAYGYNNFDANIVAVNFHGSDISQAGLASVDIAEQLANGRFSRDVAGLTFNTFAWSEGDYLSGGDPAAAHRFGRFVSMFEIGPWRGEQIQQP